MLLVKDVTRDMWGWGFLERTWRDVWDGARMLRRRPIFSFVNAIILGDLPYDRPEELVP